MTMTVLFMVLVVLARVRTRAPSDVDGLAGAHIEMALIDVAQLLPAWRLHRLDVVATELGVTSAWLPRSLRPKHVPTAARCTSNPDVSAVNSNFIF